MEQRLNKKYFELLKKAYEILENKIKNSKEYPQFKVNIINKTLLNLDFIRNIDDDELYLLIFEQTINISDYFFPDTIEKLSLFCDTCIRLKNIFDTGIESERKEYLEQVSDNLYKCKYDFYGSNYEIFERLYPLFLDKDKVSEIIKIMQDIPMKTPQNYNKYKSNILLLLAEYAEKARDYFENEDVFYQVLLLYAKNLYHVSTIFWIDDVYEMGLFYKNLEKVYEESKEKALELQYQKELSIVKSMLDTELEFNKSGKNYNDINSYLAARNIFLYNNKDRPKNIIHLEMPVVILNPKSDFYVDSDFLNDYTYNMTDRKYITNPAIGRDQEIKDVELVLVSPKKSPILLGDAGVGKTAIVEGLAFCIINNNVPKLLKDKKILSVSMTNLIAGACHVGEPEARVKQLIKELEKHSDVIICIDEVHTIIGAGAGSKSNNGVENMLKPHIDRGAIKIIGATTQKEYDIFIKPDEALDRRFYSIIINEPSIDLTKKILEGTIPTIENTTKVRYKFDHIITDIILEHLIETSDISNQNPLFSIKRRPELPVTLLEMAFSYAALDSSDILRIEDVYNAIYYSSSLKEEKRMVLAQKFKRI